MSNPGISGNRKLVKIARFVAIAILIALGIWLLNRFGIEQLRSNVEQMGVWAFLVVGGLRLTSVIIPALPGTAYSVLAGGLFGFGSGLTVICLADLISCSLSFYLSRRYGRSLVTRLVGDRFINKIDRFSQKNLEHNFWLITGFLMTGLFDFVSYGVGLTKTPWRKFAPALVISVVISNPPIVALGAGLLESGKLLLGFALLGVFGLGILTAILQRQPKI
ncbi:TVP38/TMEM64 family protein [Pleurocapsa sp. CCALA 161]|uniref:TVP38/TMEM64 family protein n=1 Tax=Pleurocapsa sp. CCALA 161 TaxID=2107688 RepID=UPI000D054D87|nr:VTT domain-containing protein [Pleurocapsa sp. CCALA 161]PSB09514.1 TVP38/TMEM64 family protein [Pleurocapsa sp. CCALA 161]